MVTAVAVFGDRLRRLRLERDLSQKELGAALGVGNTTVSQWETEVNEPGQDMLAKIAQHFGVTADYLIGRTDDRRLSTAGGGNAPDTPKTVAQRRIYDVAARAGQLPPDKIDQIADAMDAIMRMIEGPDANKHDGKKGGTERT